MNGRTPLNPEVETRLERYLDQVIAGATPDLEALARELDDPRDREHLRAGALAQEYLARRAEGRDVRVETYLARLNEDERRLFREVLSDADAARRLLPGELLPGSLLDDRHEILREVGRGGMGVVYAARDRELERDVAVKVLQRSVGGEDWEELFQRESRTLARLASRNIVAIHDARRGAEGRYIVMDLVRGANLQQILERVREERSAPGVSPRSAEPLRRAVGRATGGERADLLGARTHARCVARILREVAFTVELAHGAGVIHRDLKPQNVMLVPGGEPVLLDFGLASWGENADEGFRGTPEYFAPEQIRAMNAGSDPRTDVYQLGLLLYEMLALRSAFRRESGEDVFVLFERITRGEHPSLLELVPGVPRALAALARKAMEPDPELRYASVRELREDLDRYLRRMPPRHAALPGALRARMWLGYLAFQPWTALALVAAVAIVLWLRRPPWVPPDLAVLLVGDHEESMLEEGTPIAFHGPCVLGLRAGVVSPTFLYVFSVFGDQEDPRKQFLSAADALPLDAVAAGEIVPPAARQKPLEPGTHRLVCTKLSDPKRYEGLLVFACAARSEPLEQWHDQLSETERVSGPLPYEDAWRAWETLEVGLRGEPVGTLTSVERERIFGSVLAAERGDAEGALANGLRRYRFIFPVNREAAAREEAR